MDGSSVRLNTISRNEGCHEVTIEGIGHFSVLIITLGAGWLLTSQGYGPGINWVWTLGLGVCGLLAFIVSGGIDKASVVVTPFLMTASVFSILRQTETLSLNLHFPRKVPVFRSV